MKVYKPHLSSIGDVAANLIAVLCYFILMVFWSFGIVLLLTIFLFEKRSGLVRFHAMQASLLWLARTLLGGDLAFTGLAAIVTQNAEYMQGPFGWTGDAATIAVRMVIAGVIIIFAIAGIYHAYRWRAWRVPIIGLLAQLICAGCRRPAYTGTEAVPDDCRMARPDKRRWRAEDEDEPREDWEDAVHYPLMMQATGEEADMGLYLEDVETFAEEYPEEGEMAEAWDEAVWEQVAEEEPYAGEEAAEYQPEEEPEEAPGEAPPEPAKRFRWAAKAAAPRPAGDDPNRTLPRAMRDHPLPGGELEPIYYEERPSLLERPGQFLHGLFGARGSRAEAPAERYGTAAPPTMADAEDDIVVRRPHDGPEGERYDIYTAGTWAGEGTSAVERMKAAVTTAPAQGPQQILRRANDREPGHKSDPCRNLPREMRDSPPPAGMM